MIVPSKYVVPNALFGRIERKLKNNSDRASNSNVFFENEKRYIFSLIAIIVLSSFIYYILLDLFLRRFPGMHTTKIDLLLRILISTYVLIITLFGILRRIKSFYLSVHASLLTIFEIHRNTARKRKIVLLKYFYHYWLSRYLNPDNNSCLLHTPRFPFDSNNSEIWWKFVYREDNA